MTSNNLVQDDQKHREMALHPFQSFIVQAPAGSGKTELIIQRLLTLLRYVNKPEEILAITFTKKSAHEMRARVLKALEFAASKPMPEKAHEKLTWQLATDVLKRDKELKWNLIDNPNQLYIKTIDSFCTHLTSQLPVLSHFGSQPDIATFAEPLYIETIHAVLSQIENNPDYSEAIAKLLAHNDNDMNKLVKLIIKMLEKRDQWIHYINNDFNDVKIREQLTVYIQEVIDLNLQNAESLFPKNYVNDLLKFLNFTRQYDSASLTECGLEVWKKIVNMLLTGKDEWRKQASEDGGFEKVGDLKGDEKKQHQAIRKEFKEFINQLSSDDNLLSLLITIRHLPEPGYTDDQWEALQALLHVLKFTIANLRVTFQAHGQIDFIENAEGASKALGNEENPTDLALSLDYQIRHILVDEFQDTSSPQYRLLEMLTYGWQQNDGRSLFVVGDPMQSIYRFRQADVGLFIRMQQRGIGNIQLTPLTLSVNFRSTNTIVDWNNAHFNAIFPKQSHIGSGAVHFSHSIANQSTSDPLSSSVSMKGFHEGNDQDQADEVIEYIQNTLAKWPEDKIAILVRSRSHLAEIIPALKAAGLQYNAVEIDPLISRQSIQDLLSLTRALIHPADRIAWFAVLRAPWCGLSLSDLLIVCGHSRHDVIYERINNPLVLSNLSADGAKRLESIKPILVQAINHRDRCGIRQWILQTWMALGGPATLEDHAEMDDVYEFLDLIDEISQQSQCINLELLNERMKKLFASTHHDDALIQIMTIHSAKGLEFDTVILPHLHKKLSSDAKTLLHWIEYTMENDETALLLAPIHAADSEADPLYRFIGKLHKEKSNYEIDRLLYVAATRAKKRLHLTFNIKDIEKGGDKGSFLFKLWPEIKGKADLINKKACEHTNDTLMIKSPRPITRFTSNWKNPVSILQPVGTTSQQTHNGFALRDETARIIGKVAHSIFQQISISGTTWWREHSEDTHHEYIKRQLLAEGLQPSLHRDAITSIMMIVNRCLNDDRGKWILQSHKEAKSEYRLTANLPSGIEDIIIDRTFIDEEGTRWIIDYKTSHNQDDDINIFLSKQSQKYADQLSKYQAAIQLMETKPIKKGLYFPMIPAWCEVT